MPTESDRITQMMRNRALRATEKLVPICNKTIGELRRSSYPAAMKSLIELKEQTYHTSTLISILRDWQAANVPETNASSEAHKKKG